LKPKRFHFAWGFSVCTLNTRRRSLGKSTFLRSWCCDGWRFWYERHLLRSHWLFC
jgi:hypothetical protein